MSIVVAGEQISFFERFGFVELESFFNEKEVSLLLSAAIDEIERRKKETLTEPSEDPVLLYGHDLAITSEKMRKLLFSLKLAKAAYHLIRKKPLRYAFDCLWKTPPLCLNAPVESISSVSPLLISVVIALETKVSVPRLDGCFRMEGSDVPNEQISRQKPFEYSSFPKDNGSVAFISPQTSFLTPPSLPGVYLILGFTSAQPVYRLQPTDPHTHDLKRYGYVFGDQLKETTHPVLFR